MPKQIAYETVPQPLSIIEFDLNQGEEAFLTYTHGREHGPEIQRDGKGSPFMEHLYPATPGETTTHPDGLRLRSALICEKLRAVDLSYGTGELAKAKATGGSPDLIRMWENYVAENSRLPAHDTEFLRTYPSYKIIGQQGNGDLTMNFWNVAFLNSPLAYNRKPRLIFLYKEPLSSRTYSCLVKWKARGNRASAMTIEGVRFHSHAEDTNEMAWVFRAGKWQPSGDEIEFAASNQQIIRDGHEVKLSRLTHQFSDLRHLLRVPNLNPNQALFSDEKEPYRPRYYFGKTTSDDIWFGEAQLIHDINLQRAAMTGPIFLSRLYEGLGVSVEQLKGAMRLAGYTEVKDTVLELQESEYRFVPEDDTKVEVYFQRNLYGWTMIGLSQGNDKILCLAALADHKHRQGYKLEDAARKLQLAGAHNVLLIDEGVDVFQSARLKPENELEDLITIKRTRLRSTFIFACQEEASASSNNETEVSETLPQNER